MQPAPRPRFSYRDDPSVGAFDDSRILLVMDGNCAICSGAARRIADWDHADQIRIATITSPLGTAMLRHYGYGPDDPASWLMLEGGVAYGSLEAILRLGHRLRPGLFGPARLLRLLPRRVQDWLYARLARNRYALFGRDDLCALPSPAVQQRLIR